MPKKNLIAIGLALFLLITLPSAIRAQEAAPTPAGESAPAAEKAASEESAPAPAPSVSQPTPAVPAASSDADIITDELSKAGLAYRSGDYIGALDSLWVAQEAMWRKAPLGIRNVAFVTEQPENFGTYKPKIGETFKSPEPLILYCEPIGFTQLKTGDTYKYSIIGAFDILNSEGQVLGGQKNLGPYEQSDYRTFSTETMLVMTIGIHGLPAGGYVMRVTLTDNLDPSKSVQLDKPFNIIE